METRLGNYIHEYSVRNKLDEDIPVYSVTNSQGFCKDYFGKEVASKNKTTYKIVPKGYFAYNPSRINVGSVDWQRNEERVIVSPLYNVFYVDSEINQQYLFYFLKSNFALQNIKAVATGSVRDNLKFEMLKEFQIKLLPLEEQNEIVEKLDLITKIIEEYKAELYKYDELIKARFIEMFGDILGDRTLPLIRLCELADIGSSKRIYANEYAESGIPFYRSKEIRELGTGLKPSIKLFIKQERYDEIREKYGVPKVGDILIAAIGATIGYSWIVDTASPFYYKDGNLIILAIKDNVNPIFLNHTIGILIEDFKKKGVAGSAQLALTIEKLEKMMVVNPELELQNQFADFVQQVDKSRFIELLQDHGVFDLGLNTDEMDTYYNEFLEQVQDQKQEVIDNQEIILTLQDTSLLNVFHEKTSEEIQNELEKEISEMFNGIEGEDASKLYNSLHNQIQYA